MMVANFTYTPNDQFDDITMDVFELEGRNPVLSAKIKAFFHAITVSLSFAQGFDVNNVS